MTDHSDNTKSYPQCSRQDLYAAAVKALCRLSQARSAATRAGNTDLVEFFKKQELEALDLIDEVGEGVVFDPLSLGGEYAGDEDDYTAEAHGVKIRKR